MHTLELVPALLVAVVALATVAPLVRVPTPILLVLGGLLLALLPQVPDIVLAPDLAFLLFLPPLLYSAAFDTSIRDVRAHLQPILSLAIGLVLATTAAVAVLVHTLLPELGWPLAFALGAIRLAAGCGRRRGGLSRTRRPAPAGDGARCRAAGRARPAPTGCVARPAWRHIERDLDLEALRLDA